MQELGLVERLTLVMSFSLIVPGQRFTQILPSENFTHKDVVNFVKFHPKTSSLLIQTKI